MCVGLDELPDSEAIHGFIGGDGDVLAHELISLFDSFSHGKWSLEDGPWFQERFDPERTEFAADT